MPAETAVNFIWCVKVFMFCLSQSLQRHLTQCSASAGGTWQRCSCAYVFQLGGSPALVFCSTVSLVQTPVMWYSLQHSITSESRTVLCLWLQMWSCSDSCWLPLTVSRLPIEKTFVSMLKEVIHWGKKWKQSTGILQDCRTVHLFTSPLADSSTS